MYKYIACAKCGSVLGAYNEELEDRREKEGFKSYCSTCGFTSIPLYLDGNE